MIENRQPETVSRPYRFDEFYFCKIDKLAFLNEIGQTEIEPNLKHEILGFYIDFEIVELFRMKLNFVGVVIGLFNFTFYP